jgi:hypothetical protein
VVTEPSLVGKTILDFAVDFAASVKKPIKRIDTFWKGVT